MFGPSIKFWSWRLGKNDAQPIVPAGCKSAANVAICWIQSLGMNCAQRLRAASDKKPGTGDGGSPVVLGRCSPLMLVLVF